MSQIFVNNYSTVLTAALPADTAQGTVISLKDSGTLKTALQQSNGDCHLTLQKDNDIEIIIVSLNSDGNIAVYVRGRENTTARAWPAGTKIYCSATAGFLSDIADFMETTAGQVSEANYLLDDILGNE